MSHDLTWIYTVCKFSCFCLWPFNCSQSMQESIFKHPNFTSLELFFLYILFTDSCTMIQSHYNKYKTKEKLTNFKGFKTHLKLVKYVSSGALTKH